MALNLSPEKGVKLTKKDKSHIDRKIKQGWKSTVLLPDYGFDENGDIHVYSQNNRRAVKIVKILDDGIYVEKALKNKTLRIPWGKISLIQPTKELKDGLRVQMADGKYIVFTVYNSYKLQQISNYVIQHVNEKKLENNSNVNMYN